jgi:hypothetical protein
MRKVKNMMSTKNTGRHNDKNNTNWSYIFSLHIDGVKVYDQKMLQKYVPDFYRSLLGTTTDRSISLDINFWNNCTQLSPDQVSFLAPFSENEIKKVIFHIIPIKLLFLMDFLFNFISPSGT